MLFIEVLCVVMLPVCKVPWHRCECASAIEWYWELRQQEHLEKNVSKCLIVLRMSYMPRPGLKPDHWHWHPRNWSLEPWHDRFRSCVADRTAVQLLILLCFYTLDSFFTLDVGLLARSQYSEVPATGHLDTGFSWFHCVYKQMLRWFPRFQVATTCFSCSPPDLNLVVTNFMFWIHVK